MCGIAGILGRIDDPNRQALAKMERALTHRGPDARGVWESPADERGGGCLLAHRRLSILDLSPCAGQPMTDPTTGQTIVFNGEIYNYVELRRELENSGQKIESSGDTAVMLRWLSFRGIDSINRLRGMFAFALWNPVARNLILARDPLGIKPLYIARNPDAGDDAGWSIVFASEVRAILASGLLRSPRLDPAAVASVIWNGFVMGAQTAVRGIESLPPGTLRRFDGRGAALESKRFWSIPRGAHQRICEEQFRHELSESVRLHLASDVPLGVFLSSGVDSSAVANLAQKHSPDPIHTFTLSFEEQELSEGPWARRIAGAIGSNHREILLSESMFAGNIDAALDTLDQPTFDGLNSFYMSKAVREAGLTVALVGTGGDELFGGYGSFREIPKLLRWAQRTRMAPNSIKHAVARALARVLAGRSRGSVAPQTRWAKLPEMVQSRSDLIRLYQIAYALFLPPFQRELFIDPALSDGMIDGLPLQTHEDLEREIAGRTSLSAIAALEQRCFLGERLLRDTDAASMAVSLEVRLPLVDSALLAECNRLDDTTRFDPVGRKALLRKIGLEGLDPALFDRPKSGFVLPYDRWIRQKLGANVGEVMQDAHAASSAGLNPTTVARLWNAFQTHQPGLYWSRIWAIYVLIRWSAAHGLSV